MQWEGWKRVVRKADATLKRDWYIGTNSCRLRGRNLENLEFYQDSNLELIFYFLNRLIGQHAGHL